MTDEPRKPVEDAVGLRVRRRRLPLKEGLRWKGWLNVGERVDGGYVVDWDAEDTRWQPGQHERFIMDRCVLSADRIEEWTGVDVDAPRARRKGQ